MSMDSGLSASDVAMLNNNGFGDGNAFLWIFALLILANGGFGGGFGNNNGNANAIQADVNRGFDNQNLQAQTRDILSAVNAQGQAGIAATNQTFHDSLMANQSLYNEVARDISALSLGQANLLANQNECCCSTKQLIMQNNYDGAMRDAQTNANITAQIQSVKDMIAQNKIESLQAQVSQLQLQQATCGLMKFPTSWSFDAGYFPPVTVPTTATAAR